jgi:hypothetical protein
VFRFVVPPLLKRVAVSALGLDEALAAWKVKDRLSGYEAFLFPPFLRESGIIPESNEGSLNAWPLG